MRRALCLSVLWSVATAAIPAAAHATLVYDKNYATPNPSIWTANDDGTSARRLGKGLDPDLSPDGATVVWADPDFAKPKLIASPTASGAPRTLVPDWRGTGLLDWSPDSSRLVTVAGPELGSRNLILVDVATGASTTVAKGYFGGVSFSPDGAQLVFSKGTKDDSKFDLYRYDAATKVTKRLTSDRRAGRPLWGPKTIVFTRLVDASVRKYGPKGELYTITPEGKSLKRLTNQKVAPLLFGLSPTEFSADGTRLLAQFGGQDTSYAQVVDPATGKVRTLLKAEETGLEGLALSRDGKTVLGATGGYDPTSRHDIVTVPYAGGPPKIVVRNAFDADWNR